MIYKFRRHNKEKYWETKELTTLGFSNFLDSLFEKTNCDYLEVKIYKQSSSNNSKKNMEEGD